MKINVSDIPKYNLCCSCGACYEVCVHGAIKLVFEHGLFIPKIDDSLCVDCKLCVKICPSARVDIKSEYGHLDIFSNEDIECYVAYSTNETFRKQGTSGGVVSTIIHKLLRQGIYDKAYVLDYDYFDGKPAYIRPVSYYNDIRKSARSKYIPASVSEIVKDIKNGTIGRSIVVATPCNLLAIKRYLRLRQFDESNLLFIGLFCDKTLNYNIYGYYSNKFGKYDSLHFRDKNGNGWPGDTVLSKNGKNTIVDKNVRMSLKPYFQLNRCRFCFDKLNQLSDISCGDCYINGEESIEGKSSIVIRTDKGKSALIICSDALVLKASHFNEIIQSQGLFDKIPNYVRNCSPKGAFLIPEEEAARFGHTDISLDKKELDDLKMGAQAISKKDFKRIDRAIVMSSNNQKTIKLTKYLRRLGRLFHYSDPSLKILIDNADFENKGGELMLKSIVQEFETDMPEAQLVVLDSVYRQNINYFYKHHILPLQMDTGRKKKAIKHFLFGNILNKPWYITPDQIDVILDAGGFQFSDQWKTSESEIAQRIKYYSSFTKSSRKIIFLPQAFGPFENPLSQKMISEIYNIANLIFARELTSYDYLKKLFPHGSKIRLSSDFTCLSKPGVHRQVFLPTSYVVIIPNVRMVTHTNDSISSQYFGFICNTIQYLMGLGLFVVLLNHEGPDDERLLKSINDTLPKKVLVLSELDALEIKDIISGAKLVISSRYHGIVSGLTQHVPTLCTSWSHKYLELLKEHGCDKNVLPVDDIEQAKSILSDALMNPHEYSTKDRCVEYLCRQAVEMWNEVLSVIRL